MLISCRLYIIQKLQYAASLSYIHQKKTFDMVGRYHLFQ